MLDNFGNLREADNDVARISMTQLFAKGFLDWSSTVNGNGDIYYKSLGAKYGR